MKNHGIIGLGETIGEAFNHVRVFEESVKMQILAASMKNSNLRVISSHLIKQNEDNYKIPD